MERSVFERIVADEFPNAVPERFRGLIKNLAFMVEDEPSAEVRKEQELEEEETLLGLYVGIPLTERGDLYGLGALPDAVILYKKPIEEETAALGGSEHMLRQVIRETIWHEVAHHFGYDDDQVEGRERDRR